MCVGVLSLSSGSGEVPSKASLFVIAGAAVAAGHIRR